MQIILSRQGQGKTYEIIEALKGLAADSRAYVIVPEQFSYDMEKIVLEKLNKACTLNIEVSNLSRFAHKIIGSKLESFDVLSKEGQALLVKWAVYNKRQDLSLFSRVASTDGFCDNVLDALSDLKSNMVSSEKLDELIEKTSSNTLKAKLNEMKIVMEEYDRYAKKDHIDVNDIQAFAAKCLEGSDILKDCVVYFDGFLTFDNSSMDLLCQVVRNAKDTIFTLTHDSSTLFDQTEYTRRFLDVVANKAGVPIETKRLTRKKETLPDLDFLEAHFLEYPIVKYEGSEHNIHINSFMDIDEESKRTAYLIKKIVSEKGVRYSDINVIVTSPEDYLKSLKDAFDDLSIPNFIDSHTSIIHTSAIKAFLYLVKLASSSCEITDYIGYMKTGFSSLTRDEELSILDMIQRFSIKDNLLYVNFEDHKTGQDKYTDSRLDRAEYARKKLIKQIDRFTKKIHDSVTIHDVILGIFDYLKSSNYKETIDDIVEGYRSEDDYENANVYVQVFNHLTDILTQCDSFFGDEACDIPRLYEALRYAFTKTNLSSIPTTIDCVRVGDVIRTRISSSKYIFLLGANEGNFPDSPRVGGMFASSEKQFFSDNNIKLSSDPKYVRSKEILSAYTLLSSATDGLYISSVRQNEDGMKTESFILTMIRDMFDNGITDEFDDDKVIYSPSQAVERISKDILKVRESGIGSVDPSLDKDIIEYLDSKDESKETIHQLKKAIDYTNEAQILDKNAYSKLIGELTLSTTQLENYAKCPFAYFLKYIIGAKKNEDSDVHPFDKGTILHSVVEKFTKELIDNTISISDDSYKSRVEAIADSAIEEYRGGEYASSTEKSFVIRLVERRSKTICEQIVEQYRKTGFIPRFSEYEFGGEKSDVPAIEVKTASGKTATIMGKIDRVDENAVIDGKTFYGIIDYKSGSEENAKFNFSKLYAGTSLQMPIYYHAMKDTHDIGLLGYFKLEPASQTKKPNDPKLEIEKAFKLNGFVKEGISNECMNESTSSGMMPAGFLETLDDHAMRKIEEFTDGIYEGRIPIQIHDKPAMEDDTKGHLCAYCDYQDICSTKDTNKLIKLEDIKSVDDYIDICFTTDREGNENV